VVDDHADWPADWKEDADLERAVDERDYATTAALMEQTSRRIEWLEAFKVWLGLRGLRRTFRTKEELKLEVERALAAWSAETATSTTTRSKTLPRWEIPAGYREWLERQCADLTFSSSLNIQQGQALRLTYRYVTAVVSGQDRGPERPEDPSGKRARPPRRGILDVVRRLDELLSDSGLLLPREGKHADFYYFSFQEFLAAERLAVLAAEQGAEAWYSLFRRRTPSAEWRYTLEFLFGAYLFRHASTEAGVRLLVRLIESLRIDALPADANLAWTLADCLEIALAKGAH
jgi:hypothetical protein